ncbi:MAG: T9SS type A sorting domain-containing protein, partial [Bacteroidia bacterium]
IFNNPGYTVSVNGTLTINDFITANGSCNAMIDISSENAGTQCSISKATGSAIFNYVLLKDIAANGGATFTANNSINNGNVTGITINAPTAKNLYWVGGSGNWSDASHWSVSSGGAGGSCIPNPLDNVYFDANSFSSVGDTVVVDNTTIYCHDLNFTGATNNPAITGQNINVYGSLTLISAITLNTGLNLKSSSLGNTITTGGYVFNGNSLSFDNPTGSWSFADAINGTSTIELVSGTLNTNNQNINCAAIFHSASSPTFNVGSSLVNCDDWDMSGGLITLSAANATIICQQDFNGGNFHNYGNITCNSFNSANCTYNDITFYADANLGSNNTIHNVSYNGDFYCGINNIVHKLVINAYAYFNDNNTFDTLIFNNPGNTVYIDGALSVNDFITANGSCNAMTVISSANAGTQCSISKATGSVIFNYVLLKDIAANGGATFTANNSINNGNVTGFTINAPTAKNLYWVGGSGNWSDASHWSVSSGGAGSSCIPNPLDNVYFDANSFLSAGDTVFIYNVIAYSHDLNFTGATNNPAITGQNINVYGSLTLINGITLNTGLNLKSSSLGNTITTGGYVFNGNSLSFDNPTGSWSFADAINGTSTIELVSGTLNTNNQNINCAAIFHSASSPTFNVGSSLINCYDWDMSGGVITLSAANATIICQQDFNGGNFHNYGNITCNSFNSANCIYNDITFYADASIGSHNTIHNISYNGYLGIGIDNTVHKIVVGEDAFIDDNNTFDTLIFNNPGYTVSVNGTLTINGSMWSNPTQGFPITIESANSGVQSSISVPPNDTICMDYMYLKDINATGGAVFYAGSNSVDLGNNTGWQWTSCSLDTTNVWPGDANYDLTANNVDVLYVGLGYGYTGTTRAGASNTWVAQPSVDWLQQFANGINLKNADCNGDGIIDNNDTTAIGLNYGLTHPFKAPPLPLNPNQTGTPFYLVPSIDTVGLNYNVNIDIYLGTSALTVNNAYGIAFTLNFTQGIIDTSQVTFDYTNSMLGNTAVDMMTFNKSFIDSGHIDFALTRTDHNNISGYGFLGRCGIVIVDNVAGKTLLQLWLNNITAFDKNEFPLTFTPIGDSIVIDTNLVLSAQQIDLSQFISVYPNPAKDHLKINGGLLNLKTVELFDMMGAKIFSSKPNAHSTEINTQKITQGLYVLRCITDKGIINRRVQVLKY